MKRPECLLSFCAAMLMLGGCANQNKVAENDPFGTGPFDSQGNYREDWADDPTKWRRPGSRKTTPPEDVPVIAANEKPPANASPLPPARSTSSSPKPTPKPSTTVARTESKPKPKPVAAKPKPKPKPQPTRYVVKKGDSLYTIAMRNKTSVSALQRANGISGTLIHPGQRLTIPKR
jgi:LysM repeat protein